MSDPIYLDYNASTPVAPEVLEAMIPALRETWGNPSSSHIYGQRAHRALDQARAEVASLLGCAPEEVIFTSGGTESDNAAIIGVAEALEKKGRHLVTSAVEHAAVEQPFRYLQGRGWEVTRVEVDTDGRVAVSEVAKALRKDTVLISIIHAQNETGVLQPISDIGRLARSRGIIFHTDAAQSVGKLPTRVEDLQVDLLTVAGHKLYAPKGVGALYLRRGVPFDGLLRGAGHESGRRAGTENLPEIVGLGAACRLAEHELPERHRHLLEVRTRLAKKLRDEIPDLVIHGEKVERLPNTLSVAFPGTVAAEVAALAEGVATAAGAACHSDKPHVSSVLKAMGISDETALATLRLSVGRPTTLEEAERAATLLAKAVRAHRSRISLV